MPETIAPVTPAPASVGTTSGSGTTSGASPTTRSAPRAPVTSPRSVGAPTGNFAPAPTQQRTSAGAGFAQRANGGTVGTTSARNGQQVFASSTAPAKKKAAKESTATSTAPSSRSAAGDLWTGFKAGDRSSVFTAQASAAGQDGGLSGTATVALALLGLGLAGAGAAAVVATRTRKAKARAAAGGNGTTE